jgi:hypothetical protein
VQGRLEYVAVLLLEYLFTLRLILRFKEHAFATTTDDLGWEIRPDFFARESLARLLVIEIKTQRFVTPAVQLQLDANRKGLKQFQLDYLVWTDRSPLSRPVRHNLINMKRSASEDVADDEIQRLRELAHSEGEVPLLEIMKCGFDMTCVFSAWWQGQVYLPLARDVGLTSLLSDRSHENFKTIFLGETAITDDWWQALPTA